MKEYSERSRLNSSRARYLQSLSLFILVLFIIFVASFVIIHYYFGREVVTYLLIILGVLGVGFMFAWMNDRSQERANHSMINMSLGMTRGVNQVLSEAAKTHGTKERESFKTIEQAQRKALSNPVEYPEDEPVDADIVELR